MNGRLELITEWKGRLWAKGAGSVDDLVYSDDRKFYAWPAANLIPIPPIGSDEIGLSAFLRRREYLGVARRDAISVIGGASTSNFTRNTLSEILGVISQSSVVIERDTAWFLWEDGVYEWGPEGLKSVSEGKVDSWFQGDSYFNRARFDQSFARWNRRIQAYQLHLAAAGDSTENRWVGYEPKTKRWMGPHKTGLMTPTAAGAVEDADDLELSVVGASDGVLYKGNQSTRTDGASTAIDFDVDTNYESAGTPDIEKLWKELSMLTKVQASGTLTITPKVGGLNASAGSAISHDMTLGRQTLRILGEGRFVQLNFRQNVAAIDAQLLGFEIPNFEVGRK